MQTTPLDRRPGVHRAWHAVFGPGPEPTEQPPTSLRGKRTAVKATVCIPRTRVGRCEVLTMKGCRGLEVGSLGIRRL